MKKIRTSGLTQEELFDYISACVVYREQLAPDFVAETAAKFERSVERVREIYDQVRSGAAEVRRGRITSGNKKPTEGRILQVIPAEAWVIKKTHKKTGVTTTELRGTTPNGIEWDPEYIYSVSRDRLDVHTLI